MYDVKRKAACKTKKENEKQKSGFLLGGGGCAKDRIYRSESDLSASRRNRK